jgi:ethanolamine ammonia-lyase small subunit
LAPPDPSAELVAPNPAPLPGTGRDPWAQLGAHTAARIALGRAGGSLRTESLLEFKVAHSLARDAVHADFDIGRLEEQLRAAGLASARLASGAADRAQYLRRPDLGRALAAASAEWLRAFAAANPPRDVAIIVSDGLSAAAAAHAAGTVSALVRHLGEAGVTHYPVFLVPLARVKLLDAVGEILGVRQGVILLGERPGLSAPDSLGAYLTYEPRAGRTDADRNCVSNIRAGGLPPAVAARKIAHLLLDSRRLGLSGTGLRERSAELPEGGPG